LQRQLAGAGQLECPDHWHPALDRRVAEDGSSIEGEAEQGCGGGGSGGPSTVAGRTGSAQSRCGRATGPDRAAMLYIVERRRVCATHTIDVRQRPG
jgi:hypothetical protein